MIRNRKWCLNGCGKRVYFNPENNRYRLGDGTKPFVCGVCNARYTAAEVGIKQKKQITRTSSHVVNLWRITTGK